MDCCINQSRGQGSEMGQGETGNKHKRKSMKLVTFYKFCITEESADDALERIRNAGNPLEDTFNSFFKMALEEQKKRSS